MTLFASHLNVDLNKELNFIHIPTTLNFTIVLNFCSAVQFEALLS